MLKSKAARCVLSTGFIISNDVTMVSVPTREAWRGMCVTSSLGKAASSEAGSLVRFSQPRY